MMAQLVVHMQTKTEILSIFTALLLLAGVFATAIPLQTIAQEDEENGNGEEESAPEGFTVAVSPAQESIVRGNVQTLNVETSEPADLIGSISYASSFVRAFSGSTDEDGAFSYEWRIGGNSNPGSFNVQVIALSESEHAIATTSFTVTEAPAEEVPPEDGELPPGGNGTIPEGNGTDVVPEEPIPIPIPTNQTGNETAPVSNETAEPEPLPPICVPEANNTACPIEIPVPTNETSTNQTEPQPLPVNQTTGNQTEEIPPLPVDPPVEEQPEETGNNQTDELPEEIPVENGTTTVPIPLPINQSQGNQTEEIPPIPTETNDTVPAPTPIPEPEPTPVDNQTTGNQTEPLPPITPDTPPDAIIEALDTRVSVLENATSSQSDVFIAVGELADLTSKALSVSQNLSEDEQQAIIDKAQEVQEAIANL